MSKGRWWVPLRDHVDGRVHLAPYRQHESFWPADHPCFDRRGGQAAGATPTCLWCMAYWIRNG